MPLFWFFAHLSWLLISLGGFDNLIKTISKKSLFRKLHVNLCTKFCLLFQEGHRFHQGLESELCTLTLVISYTPGGEVIIYMLVIPQSLSLVQISLPEHSSQLSRSTWTLQRHSRLTLSTVGTWSYPSKLYCSSWDACLIEQESKPERPGYPSLNQIILNFFLS